MVQQRLNNDKTAYPIVANCVISDFVKPPTQGSWSFIAWDSKGEGVGGDVKVNSVVVTIDGNVVSWKVGKVLAGMVLGGWDGNVFLGSEGIVVGGRVGKVVEGMVGKVVGGNGDVSKANFVVVSCPWSSQTGRIFFGGGRERDGKKLWNDNCKKK